MKVLTMQDLSCYGESSLGIAWPILSAFGLETAVLPSALLSSQTTGFDRHCSFPLTKQIKKIVSVWKSLGLHFDVFYTGYIADPAQFDLVLKIRKELAAEGTLIVDPAMADKEKLYPGLDERWIEGMQKICKKADIILPNFTEFCLLCDQDPKKVTSLNDLVINSYEFCQDSEISFLIITSVPGVKADQIGTDSKTNLICFYDACSCSGEFLYYQNEAHLDGCGDLFSTLFTALYCLTDSGNTSYSNYAARVMKTIRRAHNAVTQIMKQTLEKGKDLYGPKFQQVLLDSMDKEKLFGPEEEKEEPEPEAETMPDLSAVMNSYANFLAGIKAMDSVFCQDEDWQEEDTAWDEQDEPEEEGLDKEDLEEDEI